MFKKTLILFLSLCVTIASISIYDISYADDFEDHRLSSLTHDDSSYIYFTIDDLSIALNPSNVDPVTQLSEVESFNIYKEYLSKNSTISYKNVSETDIEKMVEYAISKNYIENTPAKRKALTKTLIRIDFRVAVSIARKIGYRFAANCLEHSLQDRPSNLRYYKSSDISKRLKNSKEYKNLIKEQKDYIKKNNLNKTFKGYKKESSLRLNSTTDFHLSLNKVKYFIKVEHVFNNKWKATVTFFDKYNFELIAWNSIRDVTISSILQNYGHLAERYRAIVPYYITIDLEEEYFYV